MIFPVCRRGDEGKAGRPFFRDKGCLNPFNGVFRKPEKGGKRSLPSPGRQLEKAGRGVEKKALSRGRSGKERMSPFRKKLKAATQGTGTLSR